MARSNSAKDTSFTLRWFEDSAPRRTVTAELNKGEARNSLARAVAFHRFGRFRGRGLENQKTRAAPLNLVTAAIILFNCGYLGRAIHELRRQGMPIDPATQAQLSPLGWGRINLTGDYAWSDRLELGADGLMPPSPTASAAILSNIYDCVAVGRIWVVVVSSPMRALKFWLIRSGLDT